MGLKPQRFLAGLGMNTLVLPRKQFSVSLMKIN